MSIFFVTHFCCCWTLPEARGAGGDSDLLSTTAASRLGRSFYPPPVRAVVAAASGGGGDDQCEGVECPSPVRKKPLPMSASDAKAASVDGAIPIAPSPSAKRRRLAVFHERGIKTISENGKATFTLTQTLQHSPPGRADQKVSSFKDLQLEMFVGLVCSPCFD